MDAPIYHLDKVVKAKQEDMEDFDGPLDLILHLLSKNKIEIRDIRISELLDQYLEWMERREELNLEIASEFVTMAAHLVYIKTRMLLSIDDEEAASEMELLMAALEQHQHHESYLKIKTVSESLGRRYEYGRDYLTKQPEPMKTDRTYQYVHEPADLLSAMQATLERVENKLPPPVRAFEGIVGHEPYPVADKARDILDRLIQMGVTRFRALFKTSRSRSEVVATFLAILELCKASRIHLAGTAEDCTVTSTVDDSEEELDITVDTY
ncbi:MAG: segregation/condensation protein A [Oscillospiraceae bacterium]|nr:segregation/condensation protein A [Oscillospiraceae bacterium]